jgi:hypothetical protein
MRIFLASRSSASEDGFCAGDAPVANAWHGVAYTEIASMAGARLPGTALGLENTTVFAAGFLTPVLIPILLGWSSWGVVWFAIGVLALLAFPLMPRGTSAPGPD